MNENIAGTLKLDGMIQGPQGGGPGFAERLRDWARRAGEQGFHFSVELDGDNFSVLADATPVEAAQLPRRPEACVTEALEELLDLFDRPQWQGLFSTLRSVEYRSGEELQTLYVITPEGVVSRQRSVEAETVEPAQPLTRKQKIRIAAASGALLAVLIGVSVFFVPYGWLWDRFVRGVIPPDPSKIAVELGAFEPYMKVSAKEAEGTRAVTVTLERTDAMPRTAEDFDKLAGRPEAPLVARLAVEALARGYVRCETFGADGEFLGVAVHRIASLRYKGSVKLTVPLSEKQAVARIVISP